MRPPFDLPERPPVGLRRPRPRMLTAVRIDRTVPQRWAWEGFEWPRHRFDPLTGAFRVRYAGQDQRTAFRERYPERRVPDADADLRLVTLTGRVRTLDLTAETVLDALGVDDRISTGRLPVLRSPSTPDVFLDCCGQLADLVASWWDDVTAIRFRSRTTPSATSIAFCAGASLEATSQRLADATDVLTRLVVSEGFDVPPTWLR